jgi:DNA-binding transcriptional LysR family regulator
MHNRRSFNWDDLKPFLAVARAGSTLGAAKLLGLSQPTVQRRIAALEKSLGCQLVERYPSGYRLSPLGAELCLRAEQIEKAVDDFNRHLQLHHGRLAGAIRVTCAEPLAPVVVTPIINAFQARHPGVHVELLITERLLDLTAGKADIAVRGYDDRPRGERESALIQRKLADVVWAVYATRTYVEHYGKPSVPEEIGRHAIVAPDGAFSRGRAARWLQTIAPDATVSARSSTMLGLLAAVKSGSGLALLPKGIGEPEPNLVRILICEARRVSAPFSTSSYPKAGTISPRFAATWQVAAQLIDWLFGRSQDRGPRSNPERFAEDYRGDTRIEFGVLRRDTLVQSPPPSNGGNDPPARWISKGFVTHGVLRRGWGR